MIKNAFFVEVVADDAVYAGGKAPTDCILVFATTQPPDVDLLAAETTICCSFWAVRKSCFLPELFVFTW
jgi:hypothetical protein